jgi:hypothetical protein
MRSLGGRRFCDNTPPYRLGPVICVIRVLLCAPARGSRHVRIRYQQHVYRGQRPSCDVYVSLHFVNYVSTLCNDFDHSVKAISTTSVELLD